MQGVSAKQYDAWDIGVTTNDCFGNADVVYPVTLPAVRAALTRLRAERAHIPVVTGFLGRGQQTGGLRTSPILSESVRWGQSTNFASQGICAREIAISCCKCALNMARCSPDPTAAVQFCQDARYQAAPWQWRPFTDID